MNETLTKEDTEIVTMEEIERRFDGVLGLDFFRGHILTLDFSDGEIRLF